MVGFLGVHCDALEPHELIEKVLHEMTPILHLGVERQWLGAARMLGDDNLGAAFVGVGDDGAAVEGLVGDRTAESDAVNERRHADGIGAMPGSRPKWTRLPSASVERGFSSPCRPWKAYGLALSPPFAPWPWLAMVASTMGYSMSDSSEQASKSRTNTSALSRSRYCLKTVFQLPRKAGSVTGRLLPRRFRLDNIHSSRQGLLPADRRSLD